METGLSRLNGESVKALEQYCKRILDAHKAFNDLRYKMEVVDTEYYRYHAQSEQTAGSTPCGIQVDQLIVPIVISQADSFVGYLAELYLSGYPIFPVVSTPTTANIADKMEAIVDTHATVGGYARQFLQGFRQGIKYNFMPILTEWDTMPSYDIVANALSTSNSKNLKMAEKGYTCIKSIDAYNCIWDNRVHPALVSTRGDYTGYIERVTRNEVRALWEKLKGKKIHYNENHLSSLPGVGMESVYYNDPPLVSSYVSSNRNAGGNINWDAWFGSPNGMKVTGSLKQSMYELTKLYIRCIPADFGINVPHASVPQMFKVYFLNGQKVIGFDRCITPYGRLPLEIGTPLEDQFGLQTPSIAESQVGWQSAATTLFKIRIDAARRAVADRGIFDSEIINPTDINSSHPAAKIPARMRGLTDGKSIKDAYFPIPFQSQGLETVVNDMGAILAFSDQSSGLNAPQRGQFQKGNKSVEEWRDTMGSADNRLRLPALNVEFQSFIPIKEQIKFNLFMYGEAGTYTSSKKGDAYDVTPEDFAEMQEKALMFRIADGYTPKSKMASTDFLTTLLQQILSSPVLAASPYVEYVPGMIAHIAQLAGVRNFSEYAPPQAIQPPQGNTDGTTPPAT
jgi:hypothetical protein